MIGNGSCVQSELTLDGWFAPSSAGLGPEQTRVSGFHCTLILFSGCLNLFKSLQLQSTAEIHRSNLIQPELEIELGMLGLHRRRLTTQLTRVKKIKVFVVIYFAACLSHLECPGVEGGIGFNKVRHPRIDVERLLSCSDRTSQLKHEKIVFTSHWGWPD